jgi:hypothetical protein
VSEFEFDVAADTGHCNILHYGAEAQFKSAHDWLESVGF